MVIEALYPISESVGAVGNEASALIPGEDDEAVRVSWREFIKRVIAFGAQGRKDDADSSEDRQTLLGMHQAPPEGGRC